MNRVGSRSVLRIAGLAAGVATAAATLSATPASALDHNNFTILKNAQRNQKCLDIKTEDVANGARAQLWDCTKHDEQEFKLVTVFTPAGTPFDEITGKGDRDGGKCLISNGISGSQAFQITCGPGFQAAQAWNLKTTGEIANVLTGFCLTATGDSNGSAVVTRPCDGTIAQRWFF